MHHSPSSSPAAVAAYLRALRPILTSVTNTRQVFIRRFGTLLERVRQGDVDFGSDADHIGRETGASFRYDREKLNELEQPGPCTDCHQAVVVWLDLLVTAADELVEVGASGEPARLREVHKILAEGRSYSNRFRQQYEALVEELRNRAAARPPRRRLPFGRKE